MLSNYLETPHPNVAMEQAGLRLGRIASHIETQYYILKAKGEAGLPLTADEKIRFLKFGVFVTKKIPSIAAQEGRNGISVDLRDTFKKTPQINYPEVPVTSPLAEAFAKEIKTEVEQEEKNGKTKPKR
jgi:hypothetical protein